jgi:hypothetical protein
VANPTPPAASGFARDRRLRRAPGVIYAPIDDDNAMLLNAVKGGYFRLNAVGCRVWELLDTPMTVAALCEAVAAAFDTRPAECEDDVIAFVVALADQGLLAQEDAGA